MNPRATLFLLAVTLLAVGALVYLRRTVEPTREAAESRRYAAVFEPDDVREIDIRRGNETVALRRGPTGWRVNSPVEDRASPEAVDRLLMAARFLEVRDRQPGRKPAEFPEAALVPPRIRIELRGARDIGIDIGAGTALPQEVFAGVDGQPGVMRVPDTIVELATAAAETFRDPRLTEFTTDDIEKFTVRRADGEMTLRRERGRWMIDKPVRAPADPQEVRRFLDTLLGLRITSFGEPAANPTSTLPLQEAAISLTPRGGGEDLELRVEGGGSGGKGELAASFEPRGGSITVEGAASTLFSVSPEQLRDRSLGNVDADTVDRIAMESGGKTVTLQRDGENWRGNEDGKMRGAEEVAKLIETFNGAKVGGFRTAESARTTGLDSPPQKIVFYSWLSENTPEDEAGGHVIAGAELGKAASGDSVYARVAGSDETMTVPVTLSEAIRAAVFPADEVKPSR